MQGIIHDNLAYGIIDLIRRELKKALDEMYNSGELGSYVQGGQSTVISGGGSSGGTGGSGGGGGTGGTGVVVNGTISLPDNDYDITLLKETTPPYRLTGVRITYYYVDNGITFEINEIMTFIRNEGKLSKVIVSYVIDSNILLTVTVTLNYTDGKLTSVSSRSSL